MKRVSVLMLAVLMALSVVLGGCSAKGEKLLLGTWEDRNGNRYIFRGEGVCNLNGEVLVFNVQGYDVYTGKTADELTRTHRLSGVTRNSAWLVDERGEKDVSINLTRVKE